MKPEQFCYWLQGKLEGRDITTLKDKELDMIQHHLMTVFGKQTPDVTINDRTPGPIYTIGDPLPLTDPQTFIC